MDRNWVDEKFRILLKFTQPRSLLKPDEFYSIYDGSEKSVNEANKIIVDHIGFDFDIEVKFNYELDGSGDIHFINNSDKQKLRIEISSKYRDDSKAIGEILAHENAHAFIFLNKIPTLSKQKLEKEMFTDLTGVVLGLGEFILNGTRRQDLVRSTLTGNVTTKTTMQLGYLNDDLIKYAMTKIDESR